MSAATRDAGRPPGRARRAWARFRRDRLALAAAVFLVALALAGALHPLIAPYDPAEQETGRPFEGPSGRHWLGTDDLGRDVLSRLLEGAATSMRFSLLVVALALVVALPVGLLSGYVGGRLDNVLMRVMDAVMSIPALVLAIAVVAVLGAGLDSAMIAIAVAMAPGLTRLVRGQALAVREETFVEASHVIGTPAARVVRRHLLPNVLSPLIVQASILLGLVLLAEAGLSFLGLGAQPPTASWGSMLQRAYDSVLSHPWHVLPPGLAIALTVLAFNAVGDGLRAALGAAPPVRKHGRLGLTTVSDRAAEPAPDGIEPAPDAAGAADADGDGALLRVAGLRLDLATPAGPRRVLDGVSFSVAPGETLGLVGESGCGKTVTSLAIMRLLPSPPATIVGGTVRFDGRDLLRLPFRDLARLRGRELAMVFQDPLASLNPGLTVAHQIGQVVRWHEPDADRRAAARRTAEALELVGIPAARGRSYPHELSGGMRQRVMIAMALVCRPKLLIADEPTTALDVTVQAQVLELLKELRAELGMAVLFVTHDLGVVADICDRVAVMRAGRVVEVAPVRDVFHAPQHPYTRHLLSHVTAGETELVAP
ncbi:MAG TPA: dipeptide/oligopeptide/nickel ABC transporter permease/ATP-binding protein [Acidimicrobiales bacterium]